MIIRKLVKQGAATLMVSLPAKWTKQNNLDKGSEVEIEEHSDKILISKIKTSQNKAINLSGYSPLINRIIITHYIKGYDSLHITFDNPNELKEVKKHVIDELIGFEIVNQTKNTITIEEITKSTQQNTEETMLRVFGILDTMLEELISKNKDLVIELDSGVNKFTNFCLRMLSKYGYKKFKDTAAIFSIISSLEQIGDNTKEIAKSKESLTKKQEESINLIKNNLTKIKETLNKFSKEKAVELAKNYETIKENIKNNYMDMKISQINETIIRMNNQLLLTIF